MPMGSTNKENIEFNDMMGYIEKQWKIDIWIKLITNK